MKRLLRFPAFLALLGLLLAACQPEGDNPGAYSGTLVLEGSHVYMQGETLPGALIVLDGEATIASGACVAGPVFLIGGSLAIDGRVSGDVTAVGGQLLIGPDAQIEGDLRAAKARLDLPPGADVVGQTLVGPSSGLQPGDLFPERSIRDRLAWLLPEALLLACAAYLAARYAPKPLARVRRAAIGHPVVAAAMGLLAGIVGLILLVVIAYTLILIPVTLIGFLVGFLSIGYGWIGIGAAVGVDLVSWRKTSISPYQAALLGTLAFMLALNLISLLPVIGDVISIASAAISLGAVVLTRFGLREFVPEMEQE